MTCDNVGVVAAGDVRTYQAVLRTLAVGRGLADKVSEPALKEEAAFLYSGFIGWLLRQYLEYPPAGTRIANIEDFAASLGAAPGYAQVQIRPA